MSFADHLQQRIDSLEARNKNLLLEVDQARNEANELRAGVQPATEQARFVDAVKHFRRHLLNQCGKPGDPCGHSAESIVSEILVAYDHRPANELAAALGDLIAGVDAATNSELDKQYALDDEARRTAWRLINANEEPQMTRARQALLLWEASWFVDPQEAQPK